ncbi:MAG: response regulator, partial [Terriglobia bacterium]
ESLRVLVVDDHEIVRKGVRSLIETRPGWQVCGEAVNGCDAIVKTTELRPDIIVLDIAMPELNGLEAIHEILKVAPRTEILVLTMYESEQMMEEALQAGARGCLLKSDAARNLLAAIETLSQHRPFFAARTPGTSTSPGAWSKYGAEGALSPSLLTPREREIIQMLAEGKSTKEVASALDITAKTAETHRANIMRKLDLHSTSDLVRYAIRNNIVVP